MCASALSLLAPETRHFPERCQRRRVGDRGHLPGVVHTCRQRDVANPKRPIIFRHCDELRPVGGSKYVGIGTFCSVDVQAPLPTTDWGLAVVCRPPLLRIGHERSRAIAEAGGPPSSDVPSGVPAPPRDGWRIPSDVSQRMRAMMHGTIRLFEHCRHNYRLGCFPHVRPNDQRHPG